LSCCRALPISSCVLSQSALEPLDWPALLQLAHHHGVVPLLCRALGASPVPPNILVQLRSDSQRTAYANLARVRELLRIVESMKTAGIELIPYKGPSLACAVYGDIALRDFTDLDFLVGSADIENARQLLQDLGYRPEFSFTPGRERKYIQSSCEFNFSHPQLGVAVELHWRILPRQFSLDFDLDGMWRRSLTLTLASSPVRALSPEDLLLVLSAHAAKHRWSRLLWVADIAHLLAASPQLNQEFCLSEASRIGERRILSISLLLAHSLLDAELPPLLAAVAARDGHAKRIAAMLAERMLSTPEQELPRLASHALLLRSRERAGDQVRYALRTLHASLNARLFSQPQLLNL